MEMRPLLAPPFAALSCGISEFTFAGVYLFRKIHSYTLSTLSEGGLLISGRRGEDTFFMLPFSLPTQTDLDKLLESYSYLKNASQAQAATLGAMGYRVEADEDNSDYLYLREGLATLHGRKFHRKRNRVHGFLAKYEPLARPLEEAAIDDALSVLEQWREASETEGDYAAAREGVLKIKELGLSGTVYYVEGSPAAFAIGEELSADMYAVHFEKGLASYTGLLQFVNQSFAAALPQSYTYINREQDLGIEGLRHAKLSYRPHGFIKKFRIYARGSRAVAGGAVS